MRIFLPKYYLFVVIMGMMMSFAHAKTAPFSKDTLSHRPNKNYLSSELLATFIQVEGEVSQREIEQLRTELDEFVVYLKRKQEKYRSEKRFLSFFFYKVHRQFLKHYEPHTTLYNLLEDGKYDCVTGSALYALLLDALAIPYQVQEFPYHVYLMVPTEDQDTIMIESTDPQYGFVTDAAEQAQRYSFYSQTNQPATDTHFQYDFAIGGSIGLTELAGLSYFNEAVEHYNRHEFPQAMQLLQKASHLYASPRTEAFRSLVMSLSQK